MKPSIIKKGPTRQEVEKLQKIISSLTQCDDLITNHYFADGMYCRELIRKKGTLIVGKVHKKEHFYIVIKGHINVFTENGLVEMKAPYILVSKPGTKRVTFAVEDSVAITIHQISSRDFDEIEKELIEEDKMAKYDFQNNLKYPELETKTEKLE